MAVVVCVCVCVDSSDKKDPKGSKAQYGYVIMVFGDRFYGQSRNIIMLEDRVLTMNIWLSHMRARPSCGYEVYFRKWDSAN